MMKLVGCMAGAVFAASFAIVAAAAGNNADADAKAPVDLAAATRGTEHAAGFFDVYRDAAKGRVLLGIRAFDTPFLLVSSLPWAVGSNDIGLDRGQSSESHLVEFRRVGTRVLLVEDNTKFRALSSNPDEALSVRQAFADRSFGPAMSSANARAPMPRPSSTSARC